MSRKKKIFIAAAVLAVVALLAAYFTSLVIQGERESRPEVTVRNGDRAAAESVGRGTAAPGTAERPAGALKVMTLNAAHGRGPNSGPVQLLTGEETARTHLDAVAEVLRRERPDIVALQEADGPSFWSGGFDHVDYLAGEAVFDFMIRGEHVQGLNLAYGTALLSQLALEDTLSVTFAPSPPTFSKGFVVASVKWPTAEELLVDVVSVHFDFSRESVRRRQAETLAARLAARGRPLVVMGDFNSSWEDEDDALRLLAERLELRAHEPESGKPATHPLTGGRIDWILVSRRFEFVEHEVLADSLSDHRAVAAVVRIAAE